MQSQELAPGRRLRVAREIDLRPPSASAAMLAALVLALTAASLLAWFAKSVLVRAPPRSSESTFSASSSGLSLDEQRKYQDQILRKRTQQPAPEQSTEPKSVMQPAQTDLAPPKDDPFTLEQLKEFDGTDPTKPIYVAIKGAYPLPFRFTAPEFNANPFSRHCL